MGVQIRKQVEDRLYLESDNGCGFCGLRDLRALTIHHIEHDDGKNVDHSYDNLVVLCHNCHNIYHQKKGITKSQIIETKRKLILKTLTPLGISALKIAARKKIVAGVPFTLMHLVELGLLEEIEVNGWSVAEFDGKEIEVATDAIYEITSKGKQFYKKWKI